MIDDTVLHAMTLAKDGKFWRSTCVCGWTSKLCRSKAAAERSKFFHLGPQVTVTSKRSRTPGLRPPGSRRLATYDSSSAGVLDAKGRITPAKRARTKKARKDASVASQVRAVVFDRDGRCRLGTRQAQFGACSGLDEFAHLHEYRRSKTRGMDPRLRHVSHGALRLCGTHHRLYDSHKLKIDGTTHGADGQLTFTLGSEVYKEPIDGRRSEG